MTYTGYSHISSPQNSTHFKCLLSYLPVKEQIFRGRKSREILSKLLWVSFILFFLCSSHKRKLWITVLYLSCYSKIIFISLKLIMICWFQNCFSRFRGKTIVLLNCSYSAKPLFWSLCLVIIFTAYKTFRFVKRVFALLYASPSFMYIVFFFKTNELKKNIPIQVVYTHFLNRGFLEYPFLTIVSTIILYKLFQENYIIWENIFHLLAFHIISIILLNKFYLFQYHLHTIPRSIFKHTRSIKCNLLY